MRVEVMRGGVWKGPLLFAGMVIILVESVLRDARKAKVA